MIPNFCFLSVVGRPFAITIYMIQVYHYSVKYEVFGVNRKSYGGRIEMKMKGRMKITECNVFTSRIVLNSMNGGSNKIISLRKLNPPCEGDGKRRVSQETAELPMGLNR